MKVDLLNGKLNKTYLYMLFSAVASTIVSTIYSTVDMICVGQYSGPDGAAAIACANPIWALMFAFGLLAGVGGSVMMSNRRGAGNHEEANEFYTAAVAVATVASTVILLVTAVFMEELLRLFGADGNVLKLSLDYMRGMCFSIPSFTLCACFSAFMRSDGETVIPMVATVAGGVLNIVLDVTLVFGFDLGPLGAGIATGVGQVIAFAIILSYFFTKKCQLKFTKIHKIKEVLIKIVTVGFSVFIIEMSSGIVSAVFNNIIEARLSTAHLAVYGTVATLQIFFICLYSGIGTALQPLIATSYGAGKRDRIRDSLKLGFLTALIMGALFLAVSQLFPEEILRIYMDVDDEVLRVGPRIVRLYTLAVPAIGICLVCNYFFQSTLHRTASILTSLLRGLLLPLVFVVILPLIFGGDSIWFAIPIAELLTCAAALLIFIPKFKSLMSPSDTPICEPDD